MKLGLPAVFLLPLLFAACCLDVVSGETIAVSTGGQTATGGVGEGNGSRGGSSTGGNQPCTYPLDWTLFDLSLGLGWVDLTGAPLSVSTIGSEPDALLRLHCSGARYALIDISATSDPESQNLAAELVGLAPKWLAEGGLVLTVLQAGPTGSRPATQGDLVDWATLYGVNYSLVTAGTDAPLEALGVTGYTLPVVFMVRLSDMNIVSGSGATGDTTGEIEAFTEQLAGGG